MTEWSKDILEERRDDATYLSIVFSWDMPRAMERIRQPKFGEKRFVVGGPAVRLQPDYFKGYAEVRMTDGDWLSKHNPQATRTSLGCIRKCKFCAVSKTEGDLVELNDWPIRPIVCDNNLLACSNKHFEGVIGKLKTLDWCDFNGGLDARVMTQYHADRLAELKKPHIRLAWDNIKDERIVLGAVSMLRKAGIPRAQIGIYILIGFCDTPGDALYRLETTALALGLTPNPMRYQPLDATKKNCFVYKTWTDRELKRYMRYWSRLRFFRTIPFDEFEQ